MGIIIRDAEVGHSIGALVALQFALEAPCCKPANGPNRHPSPSIPPRRCAAFFAIMQAWGLTAEDARAFLGAPAERTLYAWRAGNAVRVPMDTLRRIGCIAGIYKALELLGSDPHLADHWIRRPNRAFGGQTPLQRIRAGDVTDLAAVRAYLDAARAPWS
jgi:pimeloyl-ACP methyl ester carboxylesterase